MGTSFENGAARAEAEIQNKAAKAGVKLDNSFSGYTVARIGSYRIVEGIGPRGGEWAAVGRGEVKVFKKREDAEEHARLSTEG